jgi:hypothetical protein
MAYREKTPPERFEEQIQGENCLPAEEDVQEFVEQEGAEIDRFLGRTNDNPFDGCDPRNQRVEDSERDARLRHKNYNQLIETWIVPAIHQKPELFTVLRDTVDAGEAAYTLARLLENPNLAARPEFRDFQEYLQDVSERRTGKFDNLSVADMEKAIDEYKQFGGDTSIDEFFDQKVK